MTSGFTTASAAIRACTDLDENPGVDLADLHYSYVATLGYEAGRPLHDQGCRDGHVRPNRHTSLAIALKLGCVTISGEAQPAVRVLLASFSESNGSCDASFPVETPPASRLRLRRPTLRRGRSWWAGRWWWSGPRWWWGCLCSRGPMGHRSRSPRRRIRRRSNTRRARSMHRPPERSPTEPSLNGSSFPRHASGRHPDRSGTTRSAPVESRKAGRSGRRSGWGTERAQIATGERAAGGWRGARVTSPAG